MAAALDQACELAGLSGKARQRVGVEHDRPPLGRARQRGGDELAQLRPRPLRRVRARSPAGVRRRCSASKPRNAREGRDHDRGDLRGVDRDGVERACERDDPGARAQRRARSKPRRARLMRRTGENERRAARIFVAPGVRPRQRVPPQDRRIDERLRRDARQDARRNADVGEADRPAERPPGLEQMAGLEAKEGDARRRLDRDAANLAGRAVEARGHVDREHRAAAPGEGVDPLDDRPRLAVDVAREPRAEEGVDDAIGAAERRRPPRRGPARRSAKRRPRRRRRAPRAGRGGQARPR